MISLKDNMSDYFLTAEEEREQWLLWKAGDKDAGNRLTYSIWPWVMKIVRRYVASFFNEEEMESAAHDAVAYALNSFNPDKGRLTTYVTAWARNRAFEHMKFQQDLIKLPRHLFARYRSDVHYRRPNYWFSISDVFVFADDEEDWVPVEHGEEPINQIIEDDERDLLKQRIRNCLTPQQNRVIVERFFHHKREATIAAEMGLSKQAVNQHKHQALAKLRKNLKGSYYDNDGSRFEQRQKSWPPVGARGERVHRP